MAWQIIYLHLKRDKSDSTLDRSRSPACKSNVTLRFAVHASKLSSKLVGTDVAVAMIREGSQMSRHPGAKSCLWSFTLPIRQRRCRAWTQPASFWTILRRFDRPIANQEETVKCFFIFSRPKVLVSPTLTCVLTYVVQRCDYVASAGVAAIVSLLLSNMVVHKKTGQIMDRFEDRSSELRSRANIARSHWP